MIAPIDTIDNVSDSALPKLRATSIVAPLG